MSGCQGLGQKEPSLASIIPQSGDGRRFAALGSHREASSPFHDSEKVQSAMHSEASKVVKSLKTLVRGALFFPSCSAEKACGPIQRETAGTCPHLLHRNSGFYTPSPQERSANLWKN